MPFPAGLVRALATDYINVVTQFNNNWDKIDTAFTSLYGGVSVSPSVLNPARGTEWINKDGKLMVYNGTTWIEPQSEVWGPWVNVITSAPYVSVPDNVLQIRQSDWKNVELRGAVQLNATADAFPDAGYLLASSGQFNLASGYCPEMTTKTPAAMNRSGTSFATGFVYATITGTDSTLALYFLPQGVRSAGNSINFDTLRYKGY
jgi:hypothetical protein